MKFEVGKSYTLLRTMDIRHDNDGLPVLSEKGRDVPAGTACIYTGKRDKKPWFKCTMPDGREMEFRSHTNHFDADNAYNKIVSARDAIPRATINPTRKGPPKGDDGARASARKEAIRLLKEQAMEQREMVGLEDDHEERP